MDVSTHTSSRVNGTRRHSQSQAWRWAAPATSSTPRTRCSRLTGTSTRTSTESACSSRGIRRPMWARHCAGRGATTAADMLARLEADVAIVGGGPAGAAAALTLRKYAGQRVVLLERSRYDGPRAGETASPSLRPLLG